MADKRRAHDAVMESERRFRVLVQGVADYAIFMLSPDGNVTRWNLGAARINRYALPLPTIRTPVGAGDAQ